MDGQSSFVLFLAYLSAASPLALALLGASLFWIIATPIIGMSLVFVLMWAMDF